MHIISDLVHLPQSLFPYSLPLFSPFLSEQMGGYSTARIVRTHSSIHHSDWASRSFPLRASDKDGFPSSLFYLRPMAVCGRSSFCAHASSTALNFYSGWVSYARCASTGTPPAHSLHSHCQPVTSYPFSCKQRSTKFVYAWLGWLDGPTTA